MVQVVPDSDYLPDTTCCKYPLETQRITCEHDL